MFYCFMLMALITKSLMSMDMPLPPTTKLSSDIIDNHFIAYLTLQEVSRFKRTCKDYSGVPNITPLCLLKCSKSLNHLFGNCTYDSRTMILGHCGLTKNKKMFEFLWDKEADLRDVDFVKYLYNPRHVPLEQRMNVYAEQYSTREKIQKIRLKEIAMAARLGTNNSFSDFLKKILPGSGFNIWDITCISSKKILTEWHTKKKTKKCIKKIVQAVCASRDVDLLLAIMGGIIEPRALKYIFKWSDGSLIKALQEKDAFIKDICDKNGRSFASYYHDHILYLSYCSYSRGGDIIR